jgi:hypothetical protein
MNLAEYVEYTKFKSRASDAPSLSTAQMPSNVTATAAAMPPQLLAFIDDMSKQFKDLSTEFKLLKTSTLLEKQTSSIVDKGKDHAASTSTVTPATPERPRKKHCTVGLSASGLSQTGPVAASQKAGGTSSLEGSGRARMDVDNDNNDNDDSDPRVAFENLLKNGNDFSDSKFCSSLKMILKSLSVTIPQDIRKQHVAEQRVALTDLVRNNLD